MKLRYLTATALDTSLQRVAATAFVLAPSCTGSISDGLINCRSGYSHKRLYASLIDKAGLMVGGLQGSDFVHTRDTFVAHFSDSIPLKLQFPFAGFSNRSSSLRAVILCLCIFTVSANLYAQVEVHVPNPPVVPTNAKCRAFLAARMQVYRELGAKWQDLFAANIRAGVKFGWATNRAGRRHLVAVPECQLLTNQMEAFAEETNALFKKCIEEADRRKDRESEVQRELRHARVLLERANGLAKLLNDPKEFFWEPLKTN
jgi:hypothetical protein